MLSENIFPELHIDKMKSIAEGWAINHPAVEKICLFRGLEDYEFDYWIVVVGPDELEPWVASLNDYLPSTSGKKNPKDHLAECFTEERFITAQWMVYRVPQDWYDDGSWAYEKDQYIDGREVPIGEVYCVSPKSELVLYQRTDNDETSEMCAENGPDNKLNLNKKYPNTVVPIKTGEDVRWNDITVSFLGDDEILVQFGQESFERKYSNAGFQDGRDGKPISSWRILCEAFKRKLIPFKLENRKTVEKTVQTLNNKFSSLFPDLLEHPIRLTLAKDGYNFAFQIKSNDRRLQVNDVDAENSAKNFKK